MAIHSPARSAPSAARDDAFEEALGQARDLAARKQLKEAIAHVWAAVDGAGSRQVRFHRRLALGRFLVERSEMRLAASLLEALDADLVRFGLEEWDPELALDMLKLLFACRRAAARDDGRASPGVAGRTEDLYVRIARLDLRAALELSTR